MSPSANKFGLTLCGPALPQAALADFLSSGGYDSHLRRVRRVFADNIERTRRAVDRYFPAGTRVTQPAGGFVLWLELAPETDSRALFQQALKQGICFAPGDVFSPSQSFNHCLRLSCGYTWDDRLEQGVKTLGSLVKQTYRTGESLGLKDRSLYASRR